MYACPPIPPAPCPPECPPSKPKHDSPARYYREIGTAVIGNHLIIRMERKKGKSKKLKDWDPPCDCDVVEIQRPTSTEGPKILKGPDNNRILFHVEPRKEHEDSMPQGISYEVWKFRYKAKRRYKVEINVKYENIYIFIYIIFILYYIYFCINLHLYLYVKYRYKVQRIFGWKNIGCS